ncbi:hypothetical protein [uncultured Pseudoflavonifractor sp.]|uniref:hypothetical protein n=1 Tax=uncultured Pseudoflavonifractor sp. TaxID=1221379 RepID=UPI0025CC7CFF|nr:hypothetical protein [uncultured Pseudoflavonifractor sp.]
MHFFYKASTNVMKGSLYYITEEQSLACLPLRKSDYSLVLGQSYCSLDILLETKEAVQIAGWNSIKRWKHHSLQAPKSSPGHLYLSTEEKLLSGSGRNYGLHWETYYDPRTSWICMGESTNLRGCECIAFREGLIAALRENLLISIWGRVHFIDHLLSNKNQHYLD